MAYLLLYVDDINLTASTTTLLRRVINSLEQKFAMADLGPLHFLLPWHHCSQEKCAAEILERTKMTNCSRPPSLKPSPSFQPWEEHLLLIQASTGALRHPKYLTLTHPDIITHAMQQVCLHMHDLQSITFL